MTPGRRSRRHRVNCSEVRPCLRSVWLLLSVLMLLTGPATRGAGRADLDDTRNEDRDDAVTTTPIKPLIVIFDENNSFDHYLWIYPVATNPPREPAFFARPDTPTVNGPTTPLIAGNPNPVAPFRLDRSHAVTCDNDNHDQHEQLASLGGLLDRFALLNVITGRRRRPHVHADALGRSWCSSDLRRPATRCRTSGLRTREEWSPCPPSSRPGPRPAG